MAIDERVLIAGAGPVGLTAAANLVRGGVPVTVFEAGGDLSEESRASTFHPPTLDMLDRLGAAKPLIAQGLAAPQFQYRTKQHGVLAQFDFGAIADATAHPYRVQMRAIQADAHPLRAAAPARPSSSFTSTARSGTWRSMASGVEIAIEREGRDRDADGPLAHRRRRRAQRRAALARDRVSTASPGPSDFWS